MKSLDTEHLLPRAEEEIQLLPSCPGDVRIHHWTSRLLHRRRPVVVYLPPGYNADDPWRYPVLYVHDGQNIFDPRTSAFGVDWGLGQVIENELRRRSIPPLVVVAVYNTRHRIEEYTPTCDYRERGGAAHLFLRALVEELKPFIDRKYNTRTEAYNTAMMGSSLGGLLTLHASQSYGHVFQRIAALSPSLWWSGRDLISALAGSEKFVKPYRMWVDMGTRESNEDRNRNGVADILDDLRLLRYVLLGRGMEEGINLHVEEIPGGAHTEADWGRRVDRVLRFLFPTSEGEGLR